MAKISVRTRQVVDWRAAVWAGLIAGLVFLVLQLVLVPLFTGGSPWLVPRYIAAIVLGEGVLPPPATFDLTAVVVALLIHFVLSLLYALLIAFILHRWGLLVGIVGGALLGLAIYIINYYTFTYFFPWFFPIRSWIVVVSHLIFGALAGGVYEALETEKFVPVNDTGEMYTS